MTKKKPKDPLPPFKFSTFHIPPQINTKNLSSTYSRLDSQNVAARKTAQASSEAARRIDNSIPGSHTIVIHPGSKTLRIGRASDYQPAEVPNVIARRISPSFNGKGKERKMPSAAQGEKGAPMDLDLPAESERVVDDPMSLKIASLRQTLTYRTQALKLRTLPHGPDQVKDYNAQATQEGGERIEDFNDPFRIDWLEEKDGPNVIVGSEVYKIPSDSELYSIRRPILNRTFNDRDYPNLQILLDDLESIIEWSLKHELEIARRDLPNYSVILIVPDHCSKLYIQHMSSLLLSNLGFLQLGLQQESLGASFGAGLSTACVVDVGATRTSVACVEDGMVLPETRHTLAYGGDDLTTFLSILLRRSQFPYKTLDLNRSHDFSLIEGLKESLCTLSEAQIGISVSPFYVRKSKTPTKKYTVKTFDEVILAPMAFFEPRVIDFEAKAQPALERTWNKPSAVGDDLEITLDQPTTAMNHSTYHLRPVSLQPQQQQQQQQQPTAPPDPPLSDVNMLPPPPESSAASSSAASPAPESSAISTASATPQPQQPPSIDASSSSTPQPPPPHQLTSTPAPIPAPAPAPISFDIVAEAAKVPLEVAICNSLLSLPSEGKVKAMTNSLLLVGGTASLPALGYALQSRLLPIMNSRFPSIQSIQVIPAPRELAPEILTWKGVSVFARLTDAHGDFWVGREEWESMGLKALRERTMFL